MSEQEANAAAADHKREFNLTIVILIVMSLNSLGTCILAAFVNASWDDMGGAKRVLLFVAIGTNWTNMIIAFVNRNFARLMAGKPPLPNGNGGYDTQQFKRQEQSPPDTKPAAQ